MTTTAKAPYVNEWKRVGDFYVHRYSILTTTCVVHAVYERGGLVGTHGSITHTDADGWLGQVSTRVLTPELDAIPVRVDGQYNQARFDAIDAWREGLEAKCYEAILAAFPDAADGARRSGEIETWADVVDARAWRRARVERGKRGQQRASVVRAAARGGR